jgi:hypothetical protein
MAVRVPVVTDRAKLCSDHVTKLLFYQPAVLALVAAVTSCRSGPIVTPVYDEQTHTLVRIDYDYDRDGRVDVRTFMKNGRVERLEGDADGDGRVDRWEYYGPDGQLLRVGGSTGHDGVQDSWAYRSGDDLRLDLSTRRDGVVDRREFYRANMLVRTETDSDHDGHMDTWEEYDGGRLARVLFDDRGLGRPTRRLTYEPGGSVRVDVAPNGDGRFVPAPASAAATPAAAAASTGSGDVSR